MQIFKQNSTLDWNTIESFCVSWSQSR